MKDLSPNARTKSLASAGAARMAQSRERRRKGLRCITIELRETEIDTLIRRKRLSPEDRENRSDIRKAVHGFLDDFLK